MTKGNIGKIRIIIFIDKNELQLTDGIQKLIEQKGKIKAVLLDPKDNVIDIGTPESYLEAIKNFNP